MVTVRVNYRFDWGGRCHREILITLSSQFKAPGNRPGLFCY